MSFIRSVLVLILVIGTGQSHLGANTQYYCIMMETIQQLSTDARNGREELKAELNQLKNQLIEEIQNNNASEVINLKNQLKKTEEERDHLQLQVLNLTEKLNNISENNPKVNLHYRDCAEIFNSGQTQSGAYKIYPVDMMMNTELEVTVYCDMETQGGGWTVFQRRLDGSGYFKRGWTEYKEGFGNVNGELWLGNRFLSAMTNSRIDNYRLRIELEDNNGVQKYAEYTNFKVGTESTNYRLYIGSYKGTAGDGGRSSQTGLLWHNHRSFSTRDRDNDESSGHCSRSCSGGFWYRDCYGTNLNGEYAVTGSKGIYWLGWSGSGSLKKTLMMLRPINYP